jgi:DnaJ family protein C protein 11
LIDKILSILGLAKHQSAGWTPVDAAMASDSDEPSLYDTLGVDENADTASITAAYRRLSRTYHPDRWLEAEEKREASKRWLGISAAYDVLADDRKRMTYDTLGPDQFALGLQVLNDTVRGPDDLRRAVQKVKRCSAEQEHQGKLRLSGATVITASVDDLSPASASRWFGAELQSVAMTQDMALELDSRSTLSLRPELLTKAGLGGSSLRIGFRRQLSGFAAVDLSTSLLSGAAALGISTPSPSRNP